MGAYGKVKARKLHINGTEVTATAAELNALDGITASVSELNIMDGVTATAAELNKAADVSGSVTLVATNATALNAVQVASNAGKTIVLQPAATVNVAVTMPAATGSFEKYTFVMGSTVDSGNSNTVTITLDANATLLGGHAIMGEHDAGNAVALFIPSAGSSNTITFDGATTGGTVGDIVELLDVAANSMLVRIVGCGASAQATPFS